MCSQLTPFSRGSSEVAIIVIIVRRYTLLNQLTFCVFCGDSIHFHGGHSVVDEVQQLLLAIPKRRREIRILLGGRRDCLRASFAFQLNASVNNRIGAGEARIPGLHQGLQNASQGSSRWALPSPHFRLVILSHQRKAGALFSM